MYHPNFVDTIPTAPAPLDSHRAHKPDPRPKWEFRFIVAGVVIAVSVITLFHRFNICPI